MVQCLPYSIFSLVKQIACLLNTPCGHDASFILKVLDLNGGDGLP
jgi:hypothetical protein